MTMKNIKLIIITALLLATDIHAQECLLSAGGDLSGTGGTISFSIGQIVVTPLTENVGLYPGVQQPYISGSITAIEEEEESNIELYSDPASPEITIRMNELKENIQYQVYHLDGILLQQRKLEERETRFSLRSGWYIVLLTEEGKFIKRFKIIKY